jgi:hypothetical protein
MQNPTKSERPIKICSSICKETPQIADCPDYLICIICVICGLFLRRAHESNTHLQHGRRAEPVPSPQTTFWQRCTMPGSTRCTRPPPTKLISTKSCTASTASSISAGGDGTAKAVATRLVGNPERGPGHPAAWARPTTSMPPWASKARRWRLSSASAARKNTASTWATCRPRGAKITSWKAPALAFLPRCWPATSRKRAKASPAA